MQKRHKQRIAFVFLGLGLLYLIYSFSHSIRLTILKPSPASLHPEDAVHSELTHRIDQLLQDFNYTNAITPIVHQSWKTHLLPTNRSKRWSASWKSCFPDWEWKLWSDEDNLALVRDHYPWFLPVYLSFPNAVERADVMRYFYMFHYGGIYTDLDNVCVRNFAHLLSNSSLVFGGMHGVMDGDAILHTYVQNSFMASRARHPFWMRLITRVMLYQHVAKRGRPEVTTGPYTLMDELKDYISHNKKDVLIYPGKYFNPFSWYANKVAACKDLGKMSEADEKACLEAHSSAFVVQFHTQSWLHGRL